MTGHFVLKNFPSTFPFSNILIMLLCKVVVSIVRSKWKLKWFDSFSYNTSIINLIKSGYLFSSHSCVRRKMITFYVTSAAMNSPYFSHHVAMYTIYNIAH
jgi:hypothetical protein